MDVLCVLNVLNNIILKIYNPLVELMKVGFYGGAFDPITKGHLNIARDLINNQVVDQVIFLPCYYSYSDKKMESGEDRLKMIQMSIDTLGMGDKIKVSDFEIKNQITGDSFIIWQKMMNYFDSNNDYYFIIGSDNVNKVIKWSKICDLRNIIKFIIINRNGYDSFDDFWFEKNPHIYICGYEYDISSTQFKNDYLESRQSNIINSCVLDYIIQNKLYV